MKIHWGFFMRKAAFIIAVLSFISAWGINEINLSALRKDGVQLRQNETVITADDASYIAPAINFLSTGEFKNNTSDISAYYLRPPGYSWWLMVHGGAQTSFQLQLLKFSQLLLYALSIYALFFIALRVLKNTTVTIIFTSFYGISTIASGFLYYTLTEAITPPLVIFFVFSLYKAKDQVELRKKRVVYSISATIFAMIFITRPVLGVFLLPLTVFIWTDVWKDLKTKLITLFICSFIAFLPMIVWQIRSASIANHYTGLHPIYNNEHSATSFRPVHGAFWNLCKKWGENGANFHSYTEAFWDKAIKGDTSQQARDAVIDCFPSPAVIALNRKALNEMLYAYQKAITDQKNYYDTQTPMPSELGENDKVAIEKINELTKQYRSHFWFQVYVKSPIKVFRELAFHSNLSLYVYQKTFRGAFWMEILRYITFTVHSIGFIALFFSLFIRKKIANKSLFAVTLICYVGYLIFIQIGIEERYTIPVLGLVLLSSTMVIQQFYTFLITQLKK